MAQAEESGQENSNEKFRFSSSVADDVWHPREGEPAAYEWWYFDALSDDGRDALVIIFLDNFIFSPRYNAAQNSKSKIQNSKSNARFPTVAFCLYRNGKPLYRAINEFSFEEFSARTDFPACRIGASEFHFEATPYGIRYILDINANLRGNKKLNAALEWLIVERDFLPEQEPGALSNSHSWNLACPRSDVTGKIAVFDKNGGELESLQFRGTGYHDHNQDARWLPATVSEWQWGRAHFTDATAIFYRYCETGAAQPVTKLFLIKDNLFSDYSARYSADSKSRSVFGVKYPKQISFQTNDRISLAVRQSKIIDSSFFYLRFLSDLRLDFGDGHLHETVGITEHLAPSSLRWRWIDWLVNMRIGRGGKGSFLP